MFKLPFVFSYKERQHDNIIRQTRDRACACSQIIVKRNCFPLFTILPNRVTEHNLPIIRHLRIVWELKQDCWQS